MRKKIYLLALTAAFTSAMLLGCTTQNKEDADASTQTTANSEDTSTETTQESTDASTESTKEGATETTAEGTDTSKEASTKEEATSILKELEDTNTFDYLVNKYGRVSYSTKELYKDGSSYSYTDYQDKNQYVQTGEGSLLVDKNGDVYSYDEETDTPSHYLFIDNYEDFKEENEITSIYQYDEKEKIVSNETKDGKIYIEVEVSKEDAGIDWSYYGYSDDEIDLVRYKYTIDAKTMEILTEEAYVVLGEKKVLIDTTTRDMDCKEYVPDEKITDRIYKGDLRTVTVVTDAGTENEKAYKQTVTKGSVIQLSSGAGFESTLYADKEYTKKLEADYNSDETVYLKRAEE